MLQHAWSYLLPHTKSLLFAGAFFVLLETFLPSARPQKKWRGDSWLDLTYSYLLPALLTPARMGMMALLAGSLLGAHARRIRAEPRRPWRSEGVVD